jgi:hypothetical protein
MRVSKIQRSGRNNMPSGVYVRTETTRKNLSRLRVGTRCGKDNPFFGKHHTEKSKLKMSRQGSVCTATTRLKMSISQEGHPCRGGWIDGRSLTLKNLRHTTKYHRWRNAVFVRDGYKDVSSGLGGDLNAHHIVSLSTLISQNDVKTLEEAIACDALWDVDNGVTMLELRHKLFHRRGSSKI